MKNNYPDIARADTLTKNYKLLSEHDKAMANSFVLGLMARGADSGQNQRESA